MNRKRMFVTAILVLLTAGSLGVAAFAQNNAPATPPTVTVQGTNTAQPGAAEATESAETESAAEAAESESESASDPAGGFESQHDYQGEETGQN